jgi:hypothetical protein
MPSDVKVTSNLKGLEQLQENLKTNLVAKLGIFADKNARGDGALTNAEIGARHEFGVISEGLPRRSFLKDPIEIKRKELLATANKVIKANINKEGGAEKIFELIGIAGEAIVQEAFESGGFGTWQPLAQSTIDAKGSEQILIETSQLRKSIISKVEKGD